MLRLLAYGAALFVIVICVPIIYFSNVVGENSKNASDPMLLYFMAKGVFCAAALILLYHIYAVIAEKKGIDP
jgi:hypothetical protein